ncbi:hypothetical protein [Burkholderia sp. LS-044]|uniref:hypothetical protein n=1 Tax=Burkholderia sp. LS-044 TaxID=1459967 RepID=UPI001B3B54EE|nr:hypothetical protein [Burkholderia sp. LS-044]
MCGLLSGHDDGHPRALSEAMFAAAMEVMRMESMTLGQIAMRVEAVHGEPTPCTQETLSVAFRRRGFSLSAIASCSEEGDREEIELKSASWQKLRCALVYFNEAGFVASPPVQRAWSPRDLPHCVELRFHCPRSFFGALNFGADVLTHRVTSSSTKGAAVVEFFEPIALQGDDRPWWYSTTLRSITPLIMKDMRAAYTSIT